MNLLELIGPYLDDAGASLGGFAPELAICVTILAILLWRIVDPVVVRLLPFVPRRMICDPFPIALIGVVAALCLAAPWNLTAAAEAGGRELFTGMIVLDPFTIYFRSFLLIFLLLFLIFTKISGVPDWEDGPDIYTLMLGSVLGMCLMASANHLLMVFLAVEMASVPSYVLVGLVKGRRRSSEAALKYAVYGAGAAGVMLYGISLLSGVLGTAHLPTAAGQLASLMSGEPASGHLVALGLGGLMLMVGLAFKLSAVPFHFWCPDVFEGASSEVDAFLSVASKAAAMALLIRVAVGFGALPSEPAVETASVESASVEAASLGAGAAEAPVVLAASTSSSEGAARSAALARQSGPAESTVPVEPRQASLEPARKYAAYLIGFLAAITCTFGNLAAYGQTNIKRLLAYSTIAHAGYMMMPVAAGVLMIGTDPAGAQSAFASVAMYLAVYLFMNLGAFAVVAFVRNEFGSEQISDYAGLIRNSPGVAICFSAILLSLIGLPPLLGFVAKFAAFAAVADAKLWSLLFVGGLNTAISLFYYLRIVKLMTIDPEPAGRAPAQFSLASLGGGFVLLMTVPLVLMILNWDDLHAWSLAAASQLLN